MTRNRASKTRTVWRRERHLCHYCHHTFPAAQRTTDHVWPKARGGSDRNTNLVPACWDCNQERADQLDKCRCEFCLTAVAEVVARLGVAA